MSRINDYDRDQHTLEDITNKLKIGARAMMAAGAIAIFSVLAHDYYSTNTVQTKVNDTTVKRYRESDTYLVFTDAGVFANQDSYVKWKFRSSDMQGELMKLKGKEVEITKYGWRVGFLSMYENVVDVKEVHHPHQETK